MCKRFQATENVKNVSKDNGESPDKAVNRARFDKHSIGIIILVGREIFWIRMLRMLSSVGKQKIQDMDQVIRFDWTSNGSRCTT